MNDLALHDIHLPEAVSIWPLAIGWWLLIFLLVGAAIGLYQFLKYKKQHREIAYRNIALIEFKKIRSQFVNDNNSHVMLRAISALLRRIALSYLPRERIASLTGEQWVSQLNHLSSEAFFNDELTTLLARGPYQAQKAFDTQQLLNACEHWIEALPKTKKTLLENNNHHQENSEPKITGASS